MKVKAKDQLHISSVKAGNILPGEVFDVSEPMAKDLVERGLVVRVSAPRQATKKAASPTNKQAAVPANKAT